MADLQQMSKILYHHDWVNVEDWARNIAQLADLSDDEIHQLECCPWSGHTEPAETPLPRPSLTERARHGLAAIRMTFRLPLRRAC